MKSACARSILVFAMLPPAVGLGWGPDGHRIIAELATERLDATAKAEVTALLGKQSLPDVSNWADEIRNDPHWRWTEPLHYADMPPEAETFELTRDCSKAGCIVSAIQKYGGILRDRKSPVPERAEALKFVVHFIGDIHCPLHMGFSHDRGGTDMAVEFFHQRTNLHVVWDRMLIERQKRNWRSYAAHLSHHLTETSTQRWTKCLDPVTWAGESRLIAKQYAYPIPKDGQLGQEYFDRCVHIVDRRLSTAGVRLAAFLNDACSNPATPSTTSPASQPSAATPDWPAAWVTAWSNPDVELRPMQIVHGVRPERATSQAMAELKSGGLGGVVCNVDFADYMISEEKWTTLTQAVKACREAGLTAWIYDEEGYPSGSAGGLVLRNNPDLEAVVLTYDPSRGDPFALRRAYEHTHASNNFHAARRYPNLLDSRATQAFIEETHRAYRERVGPHLGTTIKAFFTDEPSLMGVDTGALGESIRRHVRVVDKIDDKLKPLPTVPWCYDLPVRYHERYGQDLLSVRRSLFEGKAEADCLVRRRFWALVADLLAERYFGRIQEWCHQNGVASSGHILWEEYLLHHVPLYGNALKMLGRMDVPGLDQLSSEPTSVLHGGWMAATFPASAAMFNGGRQVMTEISEFSETLAGKPPISLAKMQATAAWQAALGVTEFKSYYRALAAVAARSSEQAATHQRLPAGSDAEICRKYCDYVGRLNALLREARVDAKVLLYYPIHDLWSEYLPVAGPLSRDSQSPRAQQVIRSFEELGRRMLTTQVPFALVDHELLSAAELRDGLWIKGRRFDALVLPAGVELPEAAADVIARYQAAGGHVLRDGGSDAAVKTRWLTELAAGGHLQPACDRVVAGRFGRNGREILLLVNVGDRPYAGKCRLSGSSWSLAEPASGQVKPVLPDREGNAALNLPAESAVVLVGPPPR